MSSTSQAIGIKGEQSSAAVNVRGESPKSVKLCGHDYSCEINGRKVLGLLALIAAAAMVVFAPILAAGVFGGGEMGFIAGGLTVGGMIMFGIAAVLLVPKRLNALHDTIDV